MLNIFQQYVTHDHTANFTLTSIEKYPKVIPHIQKSTFLFSVEAHFQKKRSIIMP